MNARNLHRYLIVSAALAAGLSFSHISAANGRNQNTPNGLPVVGGLPLVGALPIIGGGNGIPIVGGLPIVGGVVNGGVGGLANGGGTLNLGRDGNVGINPGSLGLNTGQPNNNRGNSRRDRGGDLNVGGIGVDLGRDHGTRRNPQNSNIGLDFGGRNNGGLLGIGGTGRNRR